MLSAAADPGIRGGHCRLVVLLFWCRMPVTSSAGCGRGGAISLERVGDSFRLLGSSLVLTAAVSSETYDLPGICDQPVLVSIGSRLPKIPTDYLARRFAATPGKLSSRSPWYSHLPRHPRPVQPFPYVPGKGHQILPIHVAGSLLNMDFQAVLASQIEEQLGISPNFQAGRPK